MRMEQAAISTGSGGLTDLPGAVRPTNGDGHGSRGVDGQHPSDAPNPDGSAAHVAAVRAFTRAWTAVNDVLDETYLGSSFSLTEARILYELTRGTDIALAELRERLRLDAGYASRTITGLVTRGLVRRSTDPADGRRQLLDLTPAGRGQFAELDARSAAHVADLLAAIPEDGRRQLATALDTARRTLAATRVAGVARDGDARAVRVREFEPGDLGWVLDRHAVLYRAEQGWGAGFEASVAGTVAEFAANVDDIGQRGWTALTVAGRVGSVACTRHDAETARLRLLLVEPAARGLGVGTLLVATCLDFARAAGYRSIMLTTQDALVPARRGYAAAGFRLVSTSKEDSFDPAGVRETWHRDLT